MSTVSIITPFYNEESVLERFFERLAALAAKVTAVKFEFVCVDDGSRDTTLALLRQKAKTDSRIRVVEFSRNFGKEAALSAGIDYASGDAVIPMDADLQDPPELILQMIELWQQGADVVLARRNDRSSDSWLKRKSAEYFYRIHNRLSSIDIPDNVGDFRLMDRKVVNAIKQLPEHQRFMKGLFSWVGFKAVTIDYKRPERAAGDSKFSGWKLWNFALDGITSFSTVPLRIWTYVGVVIGLLSFAFALFIVLKTLVLGVDVPGYASLIVIVLFMGSLQLISIGVLGEYIGRIYMESKRRPTYIVRQVYSSDTSD